MPHVDLKQETAVNVCQCTQKHKTHAYFKSINQTYK